MSSRAPSLPLRWHLVRLAVGTLLPAVVFAAIVVFQLARLERQDAERRVVRSARALAAAFEREMSGSIRTLQALAESDHLDHGDLEAFYAQCERVRRTQPAWKQVLLISTDGRLLLNTSYAWGTPLPPVAEQGSFARVLETHQPIVGDIAVGRGARRALAFPVRVPVMRGGALRYVLTAVITPESLTDIVASPSAESEEWTRTLVDQQGKVAARTRDPVRFVGQPATPSFQRNTRASLEGVYSDVSMDGEPVYVAFSRSQPSDWTAAVVSPRRLLDAPVADSMLAMGGLGLVLLLASTGGAWFISRRLERSITQASEAAAALAQGNPPHLEPSGVRELEQLGEALERSGQLLRERERERDANLAAAETARAAAVEATRAKDVFLAMLGHELRNPLAPIVTSMEVLRRRGLAQTPEHEVIARQLRHVVRLVDDLLDMARLARGQLSLHREPLELSSVSSRAVEAATPLIERRRHVLETDVPSSGLPVLGDADRLTQVIANLLTNAAKYTPPGGHIRLRAGALDGGIGLVVEDDGQGLARELIPRLFEPFIQGPRTLDRSEGGLGIGLALVRSLVEEHGGRVEAHSDGPGQGSRFTVWLPRHAQAEAPRPQEPRREPVPLEAATARENRIRVLVVDDNVDAAEALAELLDMSGYEVAVAHDCPQALERADAFRPEVALLDIGLPLVDGYGVAERLRERLGGASPVFAALTGFSQDGDRSRSQAAGFRHHFVKPIDIDELIAFLESLRSARSGAA
ncbi:signal transduction histidine kinase [Archangium gephyra]|uniref:histidine kinase n=1 Tax=Archangium gephyra TaxID=48 RepID=A0AAC8QCK5_9BACT|nr:ATP-binding protein [Archangium gephyra]AKJ04976.1 Chemotaxis protein methyltransferase CheR [Archangium gephyra]REG35683.1 signal transduction histidine kinase [Archangium gephyra]